MIDIVDHITQKAILNDWIPIVADANSVNYELNNVDLASGQNFLYITLPTITRGKETQVYNGELTFRLELMLGRKFEAETFSSIAETAKQKYESRLFELSNQLNDFLNTIFNCSNEIEEMGNTEITMAKNIFSASIDAALTTVTIKAWNQ